MTIRKEKSLKYEDYPTIINFQVKGISRLLTRNDRGKRFIQNDNQQLTINNQ